VRWVRPGAKATVLLDGGAVIREATVTRVSPAADLKTRTFVAEIDLPNKDRTLAPGMMVSVLVERTAEDDAITVPTEETPPVAVVRSGAGEGTPGKVER